MNPNIDINISVSSSLYFLHVKDLSCWGVAENKPAVIEIKMPGYKKPISKYFDKKDTSYDSLSLGINCGNECDKIELPDGIYDITLKASPDSFSYQTYYLKADKFQKEFDMAFIEAFENEDISRLRELEDIVNVTSSYLRMGLVDKAGVAFQEANKKLNRIKNCKNC